MTNPTFENPWGDGEFKAKFCKDFNARFYERLLKTFPLSPYYDAKFVAEEEEKRRLECLNYDPARKYW